MITYSTLKQLGLIGLITCCFAANGQTNNAHNKTKDELIGLRGMYKDMHPDGWGSVDTTYEYNEYMLDNRYNRILIEKKENIIFFGNYEVIKDSIIVFHESTGPDGTNKGPVQADT